MMVPRSRGVAVALRGSSLTGLFWRETKRTVPEEERAVTGLSEWTEGSAHTNQ